MQIINTRADLDALVGRPDYAAALRALLGTTVLWNNVGTATAPVWQQTAVLNQIEAMGFLSLDDLLAECAAAGITPPVHSPPAAPAVVLTADNVRAEAQRRIIAIVGATDIMGCVVKQLNANMMANELNDIQHSRELTVEEAAEATTLRSLATQIKAIRASSNALEPNPPVNYDADEHWP